MAKLENVIGGGNAEDRPAAGSAGAVYFALDDPSVSRDNGETYDTFFFGNSMGFTGANLVADVPCPVDETTTVLSWAMNTNSLNLIGLTVQGGETDPATVEVALISDGGTTLCRSKQTVHAGEFANIVLVGSWAEDPTGFGPNWNVTVKPTGSDVTVLCDPLLGGDGPLSTSTGVTW